MPLGMTEHWGFEVLTSRVLYGSNLMTHGYGSHLAYTVSYANAVYPGGLCQGHLFPTEPHLPLGSRSADGVVCVTADSILFHWSVSLAVPSPGPIVPVNVSSQ